MKYTHLSKEFYKNKEYYEKLYQERFSNEFTLHIPIQINGNEAFLTYPPELMQLVTKIYKEDRKLSRYIYKLPGIALEQFTKKCLIDEIKITNDIEGVYSTRKEIGDLLNQEGNVPHSKRLYGLVWKYYMLSKQETLKISSCADIRDIYNDLVLPEVLAEDKRNEPDGIIFRKDSVSIQGKDLKVIHNGVNPEDKIIAYMDECLKLIENRELNVLVVIALVHYFIGYIHPFYDGNGRLNRFISSYLLSQELHPIVGYNLSYTIKKQVDLYYKAFSMVNDRKNKGDVTPFVIIFLDFVAQAMEDLNATLSNKIEELDYFCDRMEQMVPNNKHFDVLFLLLQNTLFGEEALTVNDIARIMQVSVSAVRNYISSMDDAMLLITKIGNKNAYNINLEYFTD